MESIDSAFSKYKEIRRDIDSLGPSIVTEAETRLKVIDLIFLECLGWSHKEVLTEDPSSAGYLDHTNSRFKTELG